MSVALKELLAEGYSRSAKTRKRRAASGTYEASSG